MPARPIKELWWEGTALCVRFSDGAIEKFTDTKLTNILTECKSDGSISSVPIEFVEIPVKEIK